MAKKKKATKKKKKKAKKKPAKKKKKAKQLSKAELERIILDYERELQEEKELLAELDKHAAMLDKEGGWPLPPTAGNTATFYKILLRMYKRKRTECADYKEYLGGIRDFLKEAWCEEEEWFEPDNIERRVPGHWCPEMIEDLNALLEEGTVWSPL